MAKKIIRLTESDLHRIVKESVNKILNEVVNLPGGVEYKDPNSWRDVPNTVMKGGMVYYKGKPVPLTRVERELQSMYEEDRGDSDDLTFNEWVKWNGVDTRYFESILKELTYGM